MTDKNRTLLVTGAAGNLGRRVVEILLEKHAREVIAGSRDPEKLGALKMKGAHVRKIDFDDEASLVAAFEGVDRLLLISTDAMGETRQRQQRAAVDAAVRAGVKHVVYTSMPNPEPGSLIPFAPDHYRTEQALETSGVGWTILRNTWYADNLLRSLPQTLASGKWFTSASDGRVANVSREDCARVAAEVLASGTTDNARYDVTGPDALSTDEIARLASDVFGKPIEVVRLSDERLAELLSAAGVPASFVPLVVAFDANTRAGKVDIVSGAVRKLTGRDPQSLRQFMTANKAALMA